MQRYCFFLNYARIWETFFTKSVKKGSFVIGAVARSMADVCMTVAAEPDEGGLILRIYWGRRWFWVKFGGCGYYTLYNTATKKYGVLCVLCTLARCTYSSYHPLEATRCSCFASSNGIRGDSFWEKKRFFVFSWKKGPRRGSGEGGLAVEGLLCGRKILKYTQEIYACVGVDWLTGSCGSYVYYGSIYKDILIFICKM